MSEARGAKQKRIRAAGGRAPAGATAAEGDDSPNGSAATEPARESTAHATSGPEATSSQGVHHTPGPWRAYQHSPNPWWIVQAEPRDVADVHGGKVPVWNDPEHPATVRANALLIAAAPDLLALAKQFASECGECSGEGTYPFGERGPCQECADIRAVIAKAEGREP